MRSTTFIRTAKAGCIALSSLLIALGAVLMARPDISTTLVGVTIGAVMIAFGVIKLMGFFSKDLYQLAFQFDLAFGALLILIGAAILARPHHAVNALCILLGVEIIADGLFRMQTALEARRFGLETWWLILLLAALAGVAGAVMIFNPGESAVALSRLLGLSLAAEGALNLCVAVCAVKILHRQTAEESNPVRGNP